jgi:2-hydroxy-3-keto-5-methylthiopentenyl-1-phosphate phosphatase
MYTAKTRFTSKGIEFDFPVSFDKTAVNFKQDLVRQYKAKKTAVVYIGDGSGDFDAAKESDQVFAIKNSRLAELCKKAHVPFTSMIDFNEVIKSLEKFDRTVPRRNAC